jgi:hypothetical protein
VSVQGEEADVNYAGSEPAGLLVVAGEVRCRPATSLLPRL